MLLLVLDDLGTYEKLAARCLTLNIGLKRIEGLNARKKDPKTENRSITLSPTAPRTIRIPPTTTLRLSTPASEYSHRASATLEASVIYYNY